MEIPRPDFRVRKAIAEHFMPPVKVPDTHIRLIAWFSEGSTGAEIEALVRAYRKARAVRWETSHGLLETLRRFATLNAARIQPDRRKLLFADAEELLKVLRGDEALGFTLSDIGEISGKNKSTVSRLIGKPRKDAGDRERADG